MPYLLSILMLFPLCLMADVKIKNLVTGPKPDLKAAVGMFQAGNGGAAVDLETGTVALNNCTPMEFANAFWDIVDEKFSVGHPVNSLVTHIQFGKVGLKKKKSKGIRVGLKSGKVRWPGLKLNKVTRECWDQVQLVFKDRYPKGRK